MRPWIVVAALLGAGLLGTLAFDQLYPWYLSRNWPSIASGEEAGLTRDIQSRFQEYQLETSGATERIAALPEIRAQLSNGDSLSQTVLFQSLLRESRGDVSVELLDRTKRLVAWAGDRGPGLDLAQIAPRETSFVQDGPLYSYLIVSVPVEVEGRSAGFVIGKRLFDVNYPINNRFINNEAFTSTFSSRTEIQPKFDFSGAVSLKRDETLLPTGLVGIGGGVIGVAYLPRPALAQRIEDVHELDRRILNALALAAALLLCAALYRWRRGEGFPALLARIGSIWAIRYAMIRTNFPAGFFKLSIFDPLYFASPFGAGLAKSIGDLCITSIFLLCTVYLIMSWSSRAPGRIEHAKFFRTPAGRAAALCLVLVIALLVCLFLRGFAALVHSAMFDSDLEYNDPTFVIPPVELAVMLVSLLLAALSLVGAGAALFSTAWKFGWIAVGRQRSKYAGWLVVGIAALGVGILFGALQDNPLMGQAERMACLLGLLALILLQSGMGEGRSFFHNPRWLILAAMGAVLALLPRLDEGAHSLDRNHVELLANEIARPTDSWLKIVANKALDELSNPERAGILASGDSDDIEKLAFTTWARSILSREGYNCAVSYFDTSGAVVSDFHIGTPLHPARARRPGTAGTPRSVHMEEKSVDGTLVKWYMAYTPVRTPEGQLVGGVRVELSGGKQTILRSDAPEFLRSHDRENFERHYRTLILSEYFQGRLVSTTGETIPVDRPLPESIASGAAEGSGAWLDEEIEGVRYETYFLRERQAGQGEPWIALSLEGLGLRWHLYSYLRYILFFGLLGAGLLLAALAVRFLRGWRFVPTFRSKLLAAFVVVSLIPVVILAYYNRAYSSERVRENAIKALSNQTSVVVAEIQRQLGISLPVVLSELTNERCADIAGDLNTDFVVYRGTTLQASSKPEMFDAELLDRNLSATAYLECVLKKKEFGVEDQMIGKLPYLVGYRPIVAEDGSIIGVASVPTLYRQTEVNAERTRRDVLLYGAYAFALALSVVAGTAFAGQISAPVRRLKKATQEVARGGLEFDLPGKSRDELGDLEKAFAEMVRDLKRTQEQMSRAQRELAWREMAKQIAHEIKNPLTPMKLSLQHLRQAYKDGAKDFDVILKTISETLLVQIETLSRIATEFSTFARMPERKYEVCDVHAILGEARDLYEQPGTFTFLSEFAADSSMVNADREELRRVFINVFRNAVQAMVTGGTIRLTTKRSGERILIRIADEGPGIPPEIRSRLFEPNFSTKTDGMGLGLAIVKKIIDDVGGSISIESSVGMGTVVSILLPLAGAAREIGSPGERAGRTS